ncbi:MAG TPA: HD domain-containing protein, partial [Armatimonadetes bacterium]|nr:HD domain-containing protein [Armatimonadota bacterium]
MPDKLIRDAVHGDMIFSSLEVSLMDTAPVQRLRGIKQLGVSYLVYPSAVHTRFEHSLGTCWLAKRIVTALEQHQGIRLGERTKNILACAALLHDLTHIPFGHTFEDERRLLPRHDETPERLAYFLGQPELRRPLIRHGIYEAVEAVLRGEPTEDCPPFVQEIVAGTVCADLLDYLRRDAYFCGLAQSYDERLFQYFALEGEHLVVDLHKEGAFRHDALSELIHLLRMRYNLTERVYYHHAKVVAGAMISRALELALRAGKVQPTDLYTLRDDSFLYFLRLRGEEVPGLNDLLDDFNRRRLYKRVYFLTVEQFGRAGIAPAQQRELERLYHYNLGGAREQAERTLAQKLGVPESAVIIYCPSAKMALKEATVQVRLSSGPPQPLADLRNPEVQQLLTKHRSLWRFYVCLRREYETLTRRAGELCEELFQAENLLTLQR